ncbi:hypothetical protein SAMN04488029_1619 [Reichenbachiella faecimaris]|uniref:Uncharacterized protein n=1 Tax=Reichenbachiella faecimaris TaxID=692418 RepID=A0A1W2GAR9_REIFA|nr:hypothetical protein [Reichenbachiella faecimaris]SMD33701.1 hypothetical protein SAMN04488029_1619 [Reichenbachiella faecimaris]
MRIIVILFLIIAFQPAQAQQYTVIHVIGKIYNSQTNSYLKSGSKLSEDSKLKFETAHARAAVLSSSRGRYIIQQQSHQSNGSDLVYSLSTVLAPARGKMSTRSGGINNQMDFVKKFGESPIAIVGGKYTAAISTTSYPSDDSRFFYASYTFNGETINKKLNIENGSLVFDMSTFYAVDGITIDPNQTSAAKLFYYDSQKEESTEITSLDFVIVNDTAFAAIIKSLEDLSKEEQAKSMQEIIVSLYGSCELSDIQAILKASN